MTKQSKTKVIFKDDKLLAFKGTIEELAKLVDFDCSLTCLNIQFAKWKQSKLEEAKKEVETKVESEKEVKTKVKKSKPKKKDE